MTKDKKPRLRTLHRKLLATMFAALLAAIGTYLLVSAVGETVIENVYMSEKAQNERNLATVSSFQTYAREFDLSSRDTEYISRWAISQDDTYILLYKDRRLEVLVGMRPVCRQLSSSPAKRRQKATVMSPAK